MTGGLRRKTEARFPVMGTIAHVVVVDGPVEALPLARARLGELERRWSRFIPDSELMVLNNTPGKPVVVSPSTFGLVASAVDACHQTDGRFDPTMEPSMRAAGYDRPIADLKFHTGPGAADRRPASTRRISHAAAIDLDPALSAITLPPGVRLDLGGIAKGAAADLIAEELVASGCGGCCVNIGGDLRVVGTSPQPGGWRVTLDSPGSQNTRSIRVADGAVCTSTKLFRRWTAEGTQQHHLRQPNTGRPAETGVASTTVVAARAIQAEVLSIAMFVAGVHDAVAVATDFEVTGQLVTDNGVVIDLPGIEQFLAGPSNRLDESISCRSLNAGPVGR